MLLTVGEIKRTRVRFALLTAGAGLLVFVLLFQQLLLDGVLGGLTGAVRNQSGAVMVFADDAKRNMQGGYILGSQAEAVAAHRSVDGVGELAVTSVAFGPLGSDDVDKIRDAMVIGFQADRPGQPRNVVEGVMPTAPDEVLADRESAPGRYEIGDRISVHPGTAELKIVGFTADSRLNVSPTFWMPYDGFEPLLKSMDPDATLLAPTVLAVDPAPGITPAALARDLNADTRGVEAATRQVAADTAPVVGPIKLAFSMFMGLGYLVVGIVIGFFFLTLTLHKASSITLLRAVGAPNSYLVRSLFQQVMVVTFGGLAVGVLLMFATVPLIQAQVPLSPKLSTIGLCSAVTVTVAVLGALPPMRRILKTDPFDVVGRPSLGGLG